MKQGLPSRSARIAWRAYLALITLFVLIGEARNLAVHGAPGATTIADWVLTVALFVPAWCYALQRRVGTVGYWRGVFWIVVAVTLVMLVPVALAGALAAAYAAALLALLAPVYLAALRYAYFSPEIWAPSSD